MSLKLEHLRCYGFKYTDFDIAWLVCGNKAMQ